MRYTEHMKIVPFVANESDNQHCLQANVKSILIYFEVDFLESEVDMMTGFFGEPSWLPHCVNWLNEKGLKVKLYSPFDYNRLVVEGENYIREFKKEIYHKEKIEGHYNHLNKIQKAAKIMINNKLWEQKKLSIDELNNLLLADNTLAIAKTIHEWLDGNSIAGTSHYVTVIKQYQPGQWLIHDPGLPPKPRRKVSQLINQNLNIFGDILTISKS